MKKNVLFSCVMLTLCMLLFGACSQAKEDFSDIYNPKTDYNYASFCQGGTPTVAETEEGYFSAQGSFLFYADKTGKTPAVVCAKPNCRHEKETDPEKVWQCDGFCADMRAVFAGDGCLYIVMNDILSASDPGKPYLWKVSFQGDLREKLFRVPDTAQSFLVHRGYFYFSTFGTDSDGKSKGKIMRKKLSDLNGDAEELWSGEGVVQDLYAYGKHLYFLFGMNQTKHLNLETKECNDFFKTAAKETAESIENIDIRVFQGKALTRVSVYDIPTNRKKNIQFYTSDLDGKNAVERYGGSDLEKASAVQNGFSCNGKYLFAWQQEKDLADSSVHGFSVYDSDGKEVAYSDTITPFYNLFAEDHIYTAREGQLVCWDMSTAENGKITREDILNLDDSITNPEYFVPNSELNKD